MLKRCNKCGADKERSEFYARGAVCKVCTRAMVRANRLANAEYYRIAQSVRPGRKRGPQNKEAAARRSAKWYAANKHKASARDKVGKALAAGRITKPKQCEECGKKTPRLEAHHDDYSKPLAVRWLCDPCHSTEHRKIQVPEGFTLRKTRWLSQQPPREEART